MTTSPAFTAPMPTSLADAITLVERDFPPDKFNWVTGVCSCGDPSGRYRATVYCDGEPVIGISVIEISLTGIHHITPRKGQWHVEAHANTPLDALLGAYGQALLQEH